MNILLTGCAGFIGVNLAEKILENAENRLWGVDCLTYAANRSVLKTQLDAHSAYQFVECDISSGEAIARTIHRAAPDAIVHLAAESHVDTSIDSPANFVRSNVVGTFELLRASHAYFSSLTGRKKTQFRFVHVSTDEVYGQLSSEAPAFTENSIYAPNSPYSASKAASDHFVRAWQQTYGLPTIITHCSNNYGPHQHSEKLIPTVIRSALDGQPIPVYGDGTNVRDWIHVHDHVDALLLVLKRGTVGRSYNIGGCCERKNLDLVMQVCDLLNELRPKSQGLNSKASQDYRDQIEFVADRPGHDFRYAVDISRIRSELGWQPDWEFEQGLRDTVQWYLQRYS